MKVDVSKIELAKHIYDQLEDWKLSNALLSEYFGQNPSNKSEHVVLTKVVLIDSLYKTNLKSQVSVARHIFSIHKSLDDKLRIGDLSAVDDVAKWNNMRLISFASKFCHFHNTGKYPIFDRYVIIALIDLLDDVKSHEYYKHHFEEFNRLIKAFQEQNGLMDVDLTDIDKYLWLHGIKTAMGNPKEKINKEVKEFFITHSEDKKRL